jgi:hypothetical protein
MHASAKREAPMVWGLGPTYGPREILDSSCSVVQSEAISYHFHILANAFATFMSFLFISLAQINYIFYVGLEKSGVDKPHDVSPL